MGSYRKFESGIFEKLYKPSPQGMNFTIGVLALEYNIKESEVRELLKEWWQDKLLSLKNSGITFGNWDQTHPNDDFFFWPRGNPQFFVELTSRGEDHAANLQKSPSGDPTFLQPTVKATAEPLLPAGVGGRFRIVRKIGTGGMGAVFLAEQIEVGNRPSALKILLRKLLDDPEFLLRFQNEAASTGRIHHPNVVTIYGSGQTDDGMPYIAMEYLEGETLRETIRRRGALPLTECAEIIQQIARGLGAAHRLGIIHRDLKPDNIFLARSEEGEITVKVVDFGIAKLRESATHTVTGMVLGTPQYMSFEQASGMRSENLDARSDLYSLGIITYEMLTGRLPFNSDTPLGYLHSHLTEEPSPLRAVNPDILVSEQVENVLMKALAKDRGHRHGSVTDFAQEFAQAARATSSGFEPALRTTVRVVPPASTEILLPHEGGLGGQIGPVFQTPPPQFHDAEPALELPPFHPMGDLQPTSTPPQFSMITGKRGGAKYWMVGLVAAVVILTTGSLYFYRSGPQVQKSSPTVEDRSASVSPETTPQMTATPGSADHVNAGNLLAGKRDWDGAITEYREALRFDPKNANAHYNFGWALERKGSLQEALKEYQEAWELSPRNPVFRSAYEGILEKTKSQPEPAPPTAPQTTGRKFDPAASIVGEQGPPPTSSPAPVVQALVNGTFIVQPLRYGSISFSVPVGATQVNIKGFFRASGGTGNDIQVVIASPTEFQSFINGMQSQVFYATGKATGGVINVDNLSPGDYVLAFNNKFSALSRKQVTAAVTLTYIP